MKVKGKSGISLIVLVISILVITIISLAVAWDMKDGGLIKDSKEAISELDKIKIISAIKLEISQKKIELQANGEYNFSAEDLIQILNKYGYYDVQEKVLKKDDENGPIICSLGEITNEKEYDSNTIVLMHCENFIDSSMNNWEIINDSSTIEENGKFGRCIYVDGIIQIDTQDTILGNVWTIEWWQKMETQSPCQSEIFQKGYWMNGVNNGFVIRYLNKYRNGLEMWTSVEKNCYYPFENTNIYPDYGEWEHIAIVSNGTQIKVYINGNLNYTNNFDCTIGAAGQPFLIGGTGFESGDGFNGYIDEIRISDVARYTSNFEVQTEPF